MVEEEGLHMEDIRRNHGSEGMRWPQQPTPPRGEDMDDEVQPELEKKWRSKGISSVQLFLQMV